MKVNKTELVSLLVELGIETAGKWPLARLQKRVDKLLELNDGEEPLKAETKEGKKLLSALLAAAENKEEIEVVDDGGAEEENGAEDKPAKKGGKKGAKAEDGDKPAKKKAPRSAGGDGKPGVIASIEEFVKKASKTKPITKEQVLEKLCERFPDRDKEAMAKTVNIQLPSRLNKEKELGIEKSDKGGYYIPS